jgi:predicted transcriptional regulator
MDARPSTDEELVALLARRSDILGVLAEGPRSKRDLVSAVDASRSTVDRAVRELEALGAVETAGDCSITTSGRLLLDAYERFSRVSDAVLDWRPLLDHLPRDAPLDPVVLDGAEVIVADAEARYRPGRRMAELLAGAERTTGLAKAYTQPDAADIYHRKVLEEGMELELVFARDMYETLTTSEELSEIFESELVTAHTLEDVPYGLFLVEQSDRRLVCLLVYDAENVLRGLVVADDADALRWAEDVFERFRERAEPVGQ